MDTPDYLRRWLRSPLGISSSFAAVAAGAVLFVAGASLAIALVAIPLVLLLALVLGLVTGSGAVAAVREGERAAQEGARARMARAGESRKRLAALRLAPGPVAQARDLVVFEAGRLVETFATSGAWDPVAAEAIEEALGLVDAWQREADEAATERRFDLPDATPFPEAAGRIAAALREKARLISSRRAAAAGEVPAVDRVAIEEELT
jgi:hypothetical protein